MSKRKNPEADKRREQITAIDADIDRVQGRIIRYVNKLTDLRAKRKRTLRALAVTLALPSSD